MASLLNSAIVINSSWSDSGLALKNAVAYNVTLTLTGQGTVANSIPASAFGPVGFAQILRASPAVKSDNTVIVPAGPSTDGTKLLLGGGSSNAPADYTGTFSLTVWLQGPLY